MKNKSIIDKEFVLYKEALALKELGFDEPCFKYIYIGDTGINVDHYLEVEPSKARKYNADSLSISQPTFSQAFRWFREKHNLPSHIHTIWQHDWNNYSYQWHTTEDKNEWTGIRHFETYEEAELDCLRKLIEIVQGKNK